MNIGLIQQIKNPSADCSNYWPSSAELSFYRRPTEKKKAFNGYLSVPSHQIEGKSSKVTS